MCREYADLRNLRRVVEERTKLTGSDTRTAPAPAAEPVGGLVAVLRRLVEKVRPTKTTVAAE